MTQLGDYRILSGNRPVEELGLSFVSALTVSASDRRPWYACIEAGDIDREIIEEALLNEAGELTIELSFGDDTRNLWGTYTIIQPEYRYDDGLDVTLHCYGKEVALSRERRRVFLNQRDSEICAQICAEAGLETDITQTGIRYEHVAQIDQTDWQFLQRRAELNGFMMLALNSKIVFRPFEIEDTDYVVSIDEDQDVNSPVLSFTPAVLSLRQGEQVVINQYDKLKGEFVDLTSAPEPNPVSTLERVTLRTEDLTNLGGERYLFHLGNVGHLGSRDELLPIANAADIATSFAVRAELVVNGETAIYPGSTIRVESAGRFAGAWYVSEVCHKMTATGGFQTAFSLRRPFTREFLPRTGGSAISQGGSRAVLTVDDFEIPDVEAVTRL